MSFEMRDQQLVRTRALPASASSNVSSDPIDLEQTARGKMLADCEIEVSAPALTTTMAPDTRTMTYSLEHDTDPAFGGAVVLHPSLIVQTGAGGAGAPAAKARYRLPVDVKRYVRLKVTAGASITDSSAVSAELALLF